MTDMNHIKIGVITFLLFGMVIVLTGIVCADQGVNATPETQGLVTGTTANVVGLVTETDAGTWTLTNDPQVFDVLNLGSSPYAGEYKDVIQYYVTALQAAGGSISFHQNPSNQNRYIIDQMVVPESILGDPMPQGWGVSNWAGVLQWYLKQGYLPLSYTGNGIHDGVLDPGQIQYTTAYDANIVAQAGHTVLTKSMNIDTRNKVLGQSNLNAQTGITYIATADGGNIVGSENLMLDGAGSATSASDRMICPFAASPNGTIPAYCNIVQAGSKYDLTVGSVTTTANDKFVSNYASLPVTLNYNINVKPYGTSAGQSPAMGSTSAYIKAHIQESRGGTATTVIPYESSYGIITTPLDTKTEDLQYSETSSASGTITAFNKEMSYSSQVTGIAIMTPVPTMTPLPP
jgi:hypothetical protein